MKYRDFRYVVPFIVQFGLYISPVGFSSTIVPAQWRLLYDFNPMVGVIDGFRWAISNGRSPFPQQSLACRWLQLDFSSPLESGISGKRNVLLRT